MYDFFSLTLALFLLMDPLGNIPLFFSLLKGFPQKQQKRIILRELCIALALILFFYFIGTYFLDLIQIQQYTLFISGGIILFVIAIRMIFPSTHTASTQPLLQEPLIVPLAIPLVAGPAVLAAVMIYGQKEQNPWSIIGAIVLAWLGSTLILINSRFLQKILGDKGLTALERVMGLVLTLIAIQMFLDGCSLYIQQLAPLPPYASA